MILKRKLAYSLSIENKHLKRDFQMELNLGCSKVELKVDWVSGEEINRGV
jgi:hypothetical protein